jgi:Icc protein
MPVHLPPTRPIRRRDFLATLSAAVLTIPRTRFRLGDGSDGTTIALISDTHIAGDEARTNLNQNMAANLRAVVADVLSLEDRPAHTFIDGDLALKNGQPDDYRALVRLLAPLREAGIPIHMALGNHDDRDVFRRVLGREIDRRSTETPKHLSQVSMASTSQGGDSDDFRVVVLDSLNKVDDTPGLLGAEQLRWLEARLDDRQSGALPTVVLVHHNPSNHPGALIDTDALLEVIGPRTQVKALVYGHSHRWVTERRDDGLWLVNLPAVGYPFSDDQPIGWVAMRLRPEGAELELRAVGGDQTKDRARQVLEWR